MKGKPGLAGNIASTTLAYPGNPFKYSPKFPTDESQQNQDIFDMFTATTNTTLQPAKITRSACFNSQTSGSVILSTAGQTQKEAAKEDSNPGSLHKRKKLPSLKCDEICSLPEEEMLGTDEEMQGKHQTEDIIVDVSQTDEKEFKDIKPSCKELDKDGPTKYNN